MKTIEQVNALHGEPTRRRTTPDQRTIGFVLHSEKIQVSVEPHKFTKDWALIELYEEKIDGRLSRETRFTSVRLFLASRCLRF